MKGIKVRFQCPGDKTGTEVLFKRPPAVGAEVIQFQCQACGSHLLARVKRGNAFSQKGEVSVQIKIVRASSALVAMLKEEQELMSAAP